MRFILAVLLFIGVAHCNPFRDRFSFDDDDRHERQFSPFGFGPNFGGPGMGFDSDSDEDSDFRHRQAAFSEQFNTLLQALANALNKSGSDMSKLPPNFHNTTSTKEVVNGSIVTINETIDKQTDENNNTFFVDTKVVDVQPSIAPEISTDAAETTAVPSATTMAAVETTMAAVETTMAAVEIATAPFESTSKTPEELSSSARTVEGATESPSEATTTPLVSTSFPNQIFNELGGPSKGPEFL